MSIVAGYVVVLAVALVIALPLLRTPENREAGSDGAGARERLQREKHFALVAIKEAEFDRAMGKLSPEDYAVLKGDYEERALDAIEKLSKDPGSNAEPAGAETALANYCVACGGKFPPAAAFCPSCGTRRPTAPGA